MAQGEKRQMTGLVSDKRVILVALNEVNFDVVADYVASGARLPTLARMLDEGIRETSAEDLYDELEPWIQWPSVHTGLSYAEHKVFRLGDIVTCEAPQIFELAERKGLRVGALSPMNAANRLRNPAFFIPDPWTDTESDTSTISRMLTEALRQAVNDNAQVRITPKSQAQIGAAMLTLISPRYWAQLLGRLGWALRKPWRKAIFLDYLLHRFHIGLLAKRPADFSTIFLNAGAHLQHHYFHNAAPLRGAGRRNPDWYVEQGADPVLDVLELYDQILGELSALPDTDVIVATGLSQKPYDIVKFYYRLKDHAAFLRMVGIDFAKVEPRMTRDFLVTFDTEAQAAAAEQRLRALHIEGKGVFEEIDNRGRDLFVTLTYPHQIDGDTRLVCGNVVIPLKDHVVFVAVKNGMHQSKGWVYSSRGLGQFASGAHVKTVFDLLKDKLGLAA